MLTLSKQKTITCLSMRRFGRWLNSVIVFLFCGWRGEMVGVLLLSGSIIDRLDILAMVGGVSICVIFSFSICSILLLLDGGVRWVVSNLAQRHRQQSL